MCGCVTPGVQWVAVSSVAPPRQSVWKQTPALGVVFFYGPTPVPGCWAASA